MQNGCWCKRQAADAETGVYVRVHCQAHTSLDTANYNYQTYITSDSTNKFAYEFDLGYRFNKYVGAELGWQWTLVKQVMI